ncbi:NucA/NucB deoxyribonuclease domain-containing protein [Amorphoplanes digitatis]|uniref:NucA/NucB deoxyribonuclease domain-containing protein n=1 Tax=Actinoplanes digitatis TaxID=1868 RepID=UPI003609A715
MFIKVLSLAAALAVAAIPAASVKASPPGASDHAFVEQGRRFAKPAEPGWLPIAPLPGPGTAATLPVLPQLAPEDPPPPPTKEECRDEPDAQTQPGDLSGWYKNRYSWCAWGEFSAPGRDVTTGQIVANFSVDFTVIGYGNNGARQFDYLVYIDDVDYSGAGVNWAAATLGVAFAGCNTAMSCPSTSRISTVPGWQAVNTAAFTFTSPEVSGAGVQLVDSTMTLSLDFATPTQPEWVWGAPGGVDVAKSPIRYDSASYVGRARGAVFPLYRLVLEVDLKQSNQDESALHILHAYDRPQLTFPSWLGKSVPGKTEPLTRMYNDTAKEGNRRKSEAMCAAVFGSWNSDLDNCDEFPFASTYEGSRTGPETYNWGERYSVRLIDKTDNQYVGNTLLEVNFYRALRVLDGDKFYVTVLR